MIRDNRDVQRAEDILRGKQEKSEDILQLAELMKKETLFGYARKLLFTAAQKPSIDLSSELGTKIRQQRALCTY